MSYVLFRGYGEDPVPACPEGQIADADQGYKCVPDVDPQSPEYIPHTTDPGGGSTPAKSAAAASSSMTPALLAVAAAGLLGYLVFGGRV